MSVIGQFSTSTIVSGQNTIRPFPVQGGAMAAGGYGGETSNPPASPKSLKVF